MDVRGDYDCLDLLSTVFAPYAFAFGVGAQARQGLPESGGRALQIRLQRQDLSKCPRTRMTRPFTLTAVRTCTANRNFLRSGKQFARAIHPALFASGSASLRKKGNIHRQLQRSPPQAGLSVTRWVRFLEMRRSRRILDCYPCANRFLTAVTLDFPA